MKTLCKTLGGSNAYGLNTPESDVDYRGVFLNTEPSKILGLNRFDSIQKQDGVDEVYYEIRKFFDLLSNGNTCAIEILFTPIENFIEIDPSFLPVLVNRMSFVDTDKMFTCLRGYMQNERRLANGERTGALGGKRKEVLDKYGFSPKNMVQLFRLANCGVTLFQEGVFPVNVMKSHPALGEQLIQLKTKPWLYEKDQLNKDIDKVELTIVEAYENRKYQFHFDSDMANEMMRKLYLPYLM